MHGICGTNMDTFWSCDVPTSLDEGYASIILVAEKSKIESLKEQLQFMKIGKSECRLPYIAFI